MATTAPIIEYTIQFQIREISLEQLKRYGLGGWILCDSNVEISDEKGEQYSYTFYRIKN